MDYKNWIGARVKLLLPNDYLDMCDKIFKDDINNIKSYILRNYIRNSGSTTLCIDNKKFSNRLNRWIIHISDTYEFKLLLVNHKTIVI